MFIFFSIFISLHNIVFIIAFSFVPVYIMCSICLFSYNISKVKLNCCFVIKIVFYIKNYKQNINLNNFIFSRLFLFSYKEVGSKKL